MPAPPFAELLAIVLLVTVTVQLTRRLGSLRSFELFHIAPPTVSYSPIATAVLFDKVQLSIATVLPGRLKMAAPPPSAELPEIVQSVSVSAPLFRIPPPKPSPTTPSTVPTPLRMVRPEMVTVTPNTWKTVENLF